VVLIGYGFSRAHMGLLKRQYKLVVQSRMAAT
jgi:hypothetical protein